MTPYNYCEIKPVKEYMEKHSDKIANILHFADADGDGTISFTEFFFFITLLQLPDEFMALNFTKYEGNKMTADDFSKTLTKHRKQTKFGKKITVNNIIMDGRNVKAREEDFLETNQAITKKMFEGKEFMNFEDYKNHRKMLKEALWHFEFF